MKKLIGSLGLCILLVGGCARMQYTIDEEDPGTQATKKSKDRFVVSYTGTSGGARELVDVATRRRQTTDAGDIAKMSVERGLPVSIGTGPGSTSVTAGYGYGAYGMYGYPYGGVYGQVMYAEQASFGYGQGYLPRLGELPVLALPTPTAESMPTHSSTRVSCPKDRSPATDAERISCLEQDRATILQEIRKKE